jgi:hypothetical protein
MAPIVVPGDTSRRTLTADDQKGVCEIYPADGVEYVCDTNVSIDGGTMSPVDAGSTSDSEDAAKAPVQGGQGGVDAGDTGQGGSRESGGIGGAAGRPEGGTTGSAGRSETSSEGGCSLPGRNSRFASSLMVAAVAALLLRRKHR